MKSNILAGLSVLGLSVAAFVAVGCGDDSGAGGSGGSGGTTTSTTTSSKATGVTGATVTSTVSTGTGMMGDGNDTFAEADPMEESMGVPFVADSAELNPPDTDVDFYTFNGLAGVASIVAYSKPDGDPFASTDPDIVFELYDSGMNLIATNDDPYPRDTQDSNIITVLPTDGLYYLKVSEFCATPNAGCDAAYYDGLEDLTYGVEIYMEAAGALANPIQEAEPNDTIANATPANLLETTTAGQYFATLAYGEFQSAGDLEYFSFTAPSNVPITLGGRLTTNIVFQPPGKTAGSGSARFTGVVRIDDMMGNTVALQDWSTETDATDYAEITAAPLVPGAQYLVRVAGGPNEADGPLAPFFVYSHGVSEGNPLETADATNNLPATPEVLVHPSGDTDSYFVDGNLGAGDTDHYQIAVEGQPMFAYTCIAQRGGSGIRGLTVDILDAGGDVISTGTEDATTQLFVFDVDPMGETNLTVRITKTSQDALVTGDYYRCGFNFYTPQ